MFGRRSRRELEAENAELEKRALFLRATNRYNMRTYEKLTARCEQLEAENKVLLEKLKEQHTMVAQFLDLMAMGDCNTCAKKRTKVCTFLPGPDEPVRINCPHYTKAEVSK